MPLTAGLFAFATFSISIGLRLVNPTEIRWAFFGGDPEKDFLGWHLFRNGPWTHPIGATPLLMWPVGTSVGLTDSIPLFAFALKPFSALLAPDFQYLGFWLLCCCVLQGVFGALLMRTVTSRPELQLLGACLFVLSPPAINRQPSHAALSAHWLLLAALWLHFRDRARPRVIPWAVLSSVAAAIEPYLVAMVAALMTAAYAGAILSNRAGWKRAVLHFAAGTGCTALILWQSGYFVVSAEDLQETRFGHFSMNLLSPFLPLSVYDVITGPSRLVNDGQYEGYAYLGAGLLMLSFIAVLTVPRRVTASWRNRADYLHHVPFAIALVLLSLHALSPVVTLGRWTLAEYDPDWWGPLTLLRSSGRMFWPVYYAIVLGAISAAVRLPSKRALLLLSAAVLLQAGDVSSLYRDLRGLRGQGYVAPLPSRFWQVVPQHYQRLIVFPSSMCTAERTFDFRPFALVAGRHGIAINTGIAGRTNARQLAQYCHTLERNVRLGIVDTDSLYILRSDLVRAFKERTRVPTVCATIDEHDICVAQETVAKWKDEFDINPAGNLP